MTPQSSKQRKFPPHPLKSIKLQNILSFGPDGMELDLKPLNVLIGPNAAGKSNFLQAMALVRSLPSDPHALFKETGGVREWLWKGKPLAQQRCALPKLDIILENPFGPDDLRYAVHLFCDPPLFRQEELCDRARGKDGSFYFRVPERARVEVKGQVRRDLDPNFSILSQLRDPGEHPKITYVARLFSEFRLFRDWEFGPRAEIRRPQRLNTHGDFLVADASNLALVLRDLEQRGVLKTVVSQLRRVYDEAEQVSVKIIEGFLALSVKERGLSSPVGPERLSDGTLRCLLLAAILCHPELPPLVCIEEPELGFHPDVMPVLAELLVDASARTQLIVTTHSPDLVDALSSTPESIVVCERAPEGTQMRRLDPKRLTKWLDEYRLGELWQKGEIGGTRW